MIHLKRVFGLILLMSLFSFLLAGTTGKIAGIAVDKNTGEPLIGVNLVLDGTSLGASSDIDGTFIILNIPPGSYTLTAEYIGYASVKTTDLKINVDRTTELKIELQEAALELGEVVTVIAERDMVVKDLTASTATVDADRIESLPITEISEALELQAGYVDGHARGGRTGEIAYWIDGVPITDAYDGGQVVEVNKDMVEQLQFISGAFNAEYGQAMSGIVNITTKEPSEKFGGNFSAYTGDFYSAHDDVFWNTGDFDPSHIYNVEGGIFGTIIPKKLSYYANARYVYFGGHLYGQRRFNPENVAYDDSLGNFIASRDASGVGDNDYVPMNWNRKVYLQGKLIYNFSPLIKTFYSFIRDDVEFEEYNRDYKLNPDGNLNRFRTGNTHILKMTHTLSSTTFYDLGASYFDKVYKQYVYEDPYDARYVHPFIDERTPGANQFKTGGTNNQHFERNTETLVVKFDITSQVSKKHMFKAGLEYKRHNIYFDDITLRPTIGDFNPAQDDPFVENNILPVGSLFHSQYRHKPLEYSAYIQDKMEFQDLIVNLGVRIDHFRPDGVILADETDPDVYSPRNPANYFTPFEERLGYWYKDAKNKTQVSPRLGVSFPITETGVVHFSYGHFFQVPSFELLYRNPQFRFQDAGASNWGVIGNADLDPEQTISGEIGLQQQIGLMHALDVTVYFRDIRDLTGTRADEIEIYGNTGATYSKFVNSDFGFIKGFIVSLKKKYSMGVNYTVDYTFQIAKGTASDPEATRNALAGGEVPEVHLIALNWDQRHTLNATVSYNATSWGASLIGRLGTGQPYSPRITADVSVLRNNSQLKPTTYNVDLRLHKDFKVFQQKLTFFTRVLNLFDRLNASNVYDDSGQPGFTTDLQTAKNNNTVEYVNTMEEWFTNATHYHEPRRIELGFMFNF